MICRIAYPGGTEGSFGESSHLYYTASGRLARIVDPDSVATDFAYDSLGQLTAIRTPKMNDWLWNTGTTASDVHLINIAYTAGKATQVTLPAVDGVTTANRQTTTLTYASATTTYVDKTGVTGTTSGHARTVTFDAAYRQLTETDAAGLTSSQVWSEKDQKLAATDPAGRMSTTIFDNRDRAITSYGPAPASCFGTDRRPLASCAIKPAEANTSYDEGLNGLNTTWFSNERWAGKPIAFGLGLGGTSGGSLSRNFGTAAPVDGITGNAAYSARMTGIIELPTTGTYQLETVADDIVTIWLDDRLILNQPSYGSLQFTVTDLSAGPHRIRVHYANTMGIGSLDVRWRPPGTSAFTTIPGSALTPDYNLVTSTTTADSAPLTTPAGMPAVSSAQVPVERTKTEYEQPWLGLATKSIQDPTGLALTTLTTYEPLGSGFLRRTGRYLPAAVAEAGGSTPPANRGTTYAYYGNKEGLAVATCGVPAGTSQAGMLKTSTDPAPATGSAVVTTFVYDAWGRSVGVKKSSDDWTCTTLDGRGQVTAVSYPASGGSPSRTVTTEYRVGTDVLTKRTTDTAVTTAGGTPISQTIDLLGRVVSYTDSWGVTTTTGYDAASRPVTQATARGASTFTQTSVFDANGKLTAVKDGTVTLATLTYTSGGDIASVTYPSGTGNGGNATSLAISQDPAGAVTSLAWTLGASNTITNTVARSQSGRILADTLTQNTTTYASSYSYDSAGRLTNATIPRHQLQYTYAATGGCGVNARAGANGNRTATSDSLDGAAATLTTACYDWADRLTSTSVTNPATGATPLTGTNLSSSTLLYDAKGNTTTLADQALTYDATNRHSSTTTPSGSVTYLRDGAGRSSLGRKLSLAPQPQAATPTPVQAMVQRSF